jgi:putative colanic acid biosynthesis acetyltransferase WcaB
MLLLMSQPKWKILQDWAANKRNWKGRFVLLLFRLARWFRHTNVLIMILGLPYLILYRISIEWVLGIELPWNLEIGEGTKLYHGHALVINDKSILGSGVTLRHCTTIGSKVLADGIEYAPKIGNNVDLGSNVVILGNVLVGNNAIIGAGSVVVKDVPEYAVVAGNPAKILYVRSTSVY